MALSQNLRWWIVDLVNSVTSWRQAAKHFQVSVSSAIRFAYIKRGTPQLNGKVERSHHSDQQWFYQLLSYKGNVPQVKSDYRVL